MKTKIGLIVVLASVLSFLGAGTGAASAEQRETAAREEISSVPTATPAPLLLPEAEIVPVTLGGSLLRNYTSHTPDAEALLAEGSDLTLPEDGPQILILHSHSTEAYTMEAGATYEPSGSWRTTDISQNVVTVGWALKTALEEYGLNVLHDTALYDWPEYNGSYVRSARAIEEYLAEYPDIAMVIDLHRDALGNDERIYKTLADCETPTAQLMFVVGTDENLTHPLWEDNLTLALEMQAAANELCPTLMRPIDLSSCRYNQQYTTGSIILEAGCCGNTLAEAVAAVRLFARAVGPMLAGRVGA